jgi:hypothetical protein
MEGNDIADFGGETYNVVVLEPTLVYLDRQVRRRSRLRRRPTVSEIVGQYRINQLMGRWIHQQGYAYSIRTAVWGFGDRDTFDAVIEHIGRLFGRYIFRYEHFEREEDARAALMADGSIHSVYDADEDRLERLWGMRGHRVTPGGAP